VPGVGITRLTLTAFRSYSRLRLDLERRPVVLTGANGAGKTNLLEALSFLAPGRGLRGAKLTTVGQTAIGPALVNDESRTPQPWAVAAVLATDQGPVELASGIDPLKPTRRVVRIDDMPAKGAAALGRQLGVIWLTR